MLNFRNFSWEWGLGRGLPPPQIIVIESHIKEMHFQNVYHWAYTLYKKIFYTVKLLTYCTSLLVDCSILCYGGQCVYSI